MVVCFSPDSAARDLKLRTGAIELMQPVLERVNAGADDDAITAHGLYRRFVTRGVDGKFHLDKQKLERESHCDGTFVLEVSDDTMTAEAAALAYKGLLRVEQSFRALKHGVDIRPVYHRLDKRIRSHVSLCMLAYLLERIVEIETGIPFTQLSTHLMRVRAVELTFDQRTVWDVSRTSPEVRAALTKMKLPNPPPANLLKSPIPVVTEPATISRGLCRIYSTTYLRFRASPAVEPGTKGTPLWDTEFRQHPR